MSTVITKLPELLTTFNRTNASDAEVAQMGQMTKEILKYVPPKHLLKEFDRYYDAPEDSVEEQLAAASVCSMIMNIRKKPYMLELSAEQLNMVKQAKQDQMISDLLEKWIKQGLNRILLYRNAQDEMKKMLRFSEIRYQSDIAKIEREYSNSTSRQALPLKKALLVNQEKIYQDRVKDINSSFEKIIKKICPPPDCNFDKLEKAFKDSLKKKTNGCSNGEGFDEGQSQACQYQQYYAIEVESLSVSSKSNSQDKGLQMPE
jgi:hypothetical protein